MTEWMNLLFVLYKKNSDYPWYWIWTYLKQSLSWDSVDHGTACLKYSKSQNKKNLANKGESTLFSWVQNIKVRLGVNN